MAYWQAKKDLAFINAFRNTVVSFWTSEDEIQRVIDESSVNYRLSGQLQPATASLRQQNQGIREQLAKDIIRANRLALRRGVPIVITSTPPPAVGGYRINFYLFDAILRDPSHGAVIGRGIERQQIFDTINTTIGACEDQVETEWKHLINPLYWIKAAFVFILRIPANLISLAGFNVEKFEEHFWGKAINLIWIFFVIGVLLLLGLSRTQVAGVIKKLVLKD